MAVKRGLKPDDGHRNCSTEEYEKAKCSAEHLSPIMARKLIREGAIAAINRLRKYPESFRYPELSPPYRMVIEFREYVERKHAPHTKINEHPDSIIGLMNMPWSL